jgi:hypothetical protein
MSLGIAFKGPEGIVLAADSRVTLMVSMQVPGQPNPMLLPATYDNATKLLHIKEHNNVAAVTFGQAVFGNTQRTVHSFLPEFAIELGGNELTVEAFATQLGTFFVEKWRDAGMPVPAPAGGDMFFFVGGYSPGAPYGEVYEVVVPSRPAPVLKVPIGEFGMVWGGQRNITDRIVVGFDEAAIDLIYNALNIAPAQRNPDALKNALKMQLQLKIPANLLPLQDCVDYVICLIRSTIQLQKWTVDIRGVGGAVDVATITRTAGFRPVQLKQIVGEIMNQERD